jgi:toxin secretion/phage lysis holin
VQILKENMLDIIKALAVGVGGVIGTLIGDVSGLMYTLIVFMVLDYTTGVMVAIGSKNLNSAVGFKGLAKKMFIMVVIIIANLIDVNVLGGGGTMRTAAIFFYLANEGVSLLENGSKIGVPLPPKLKDVLVQLKEKE